MFIGEKITYYEVNFTADITLHIQIFFHCISFHINQNKVYQIMSVIFSLDKSFLRQATNFEFDFL